LYYLFKKKKSKERERGNFFLFLQGEIDSHWDYVHLPAAAVTRKKNFHSRAYPSSHEILHAERERELKTGIEKKMIKCVCVQISSR
jgi:hypothetical protein